jgi:hypothetical protein
VLLTAVFTSGCLRVYREDKLTTDSQASFIGVEAWVTADAELTSLALTSGARGAERAVKTGGKTCLVVERARFAFNAGDLRLQSGDLASI